MQRDAAPAFVLGRAPCPSMVPEPRPGAPAPQRAGTASAADSCFNPAQNESSTLTAAEYHLEHGSLAVRYSRLTGQPTLPPDLEPLAALALEPSAIMQRIVSADQPTAVLDIDRYVPFSQGYDADELADLFDQRLHQDIQVAFQALTTDRARAVWCREPPA